MIFWSTNLILSLISLLLLGKITGLSESVLTGNSVRDFYTQEKYASVVIFVSVIYITIFSVFRKACGRYREALRPQFLLGEPRAVDKRFWLFAILIIAVTFANNYGSNVFESTYGGDDFWKKKFLISSWNVVYAVLVAHFFVRYRMSRASFFVVLFSSLYALLHGNRGEILGVVFVVIMFVNRLSKIRFFLFFVVSIFSLIVVGIVRSIPSEVWLANPQVVLDNAIQLIENGYLPTLSSIAYSSVAAVGISNSEAVFDPQNFLYRYTLELIPGGGFDGTAVDTSVVVAEIADSRGGLLIPVELYAYFGYVGVVISALLFSVFFFRIYHQASRKKIWQILYVAVVIMWPKGLMYGMIYLVNLCAFFVVYVTVLYMVKRLGP